MVHGASGLRKHELTQRRYLALHGRQSLRQQRNLLILLANDTLVSLFHLKHFFFVAGLLLLESVRHSRLGILELQVTWLRSGFLYAAARLQCLLAKLTVRRRSFSYESVLAVDLLRWEVRATSPIGRLSAPWTQVRRQALLLANRLTSRILSRRLLLQSITGKGNARRRINLLLFVAHEIHAKAGPQLHLTSHQETTLKVPRRLQWLHALILVRGYERMGVLDESRTHLLASRLVLPARLRHHVLIGARHFNRNHGLREADRAGIIDDKVLLHRFLLEVL